MGRDQLPREARKDIPTFQQLISILELVDGESVIVRIYLREHVGTDQSGIASIVGKFHQVPARYAGREFAIGTPYAERGPAHLAGGVLFLDQTSFEQGSLRTFDGNDHFIISITTRDLEILVQDGDSTGP